jgi:ketosteroid isomerase-like protein
MPEDFVRHAVPPCRRPNSRSFEERFAVRLPRLAARLRALVLGLSPRSRLRSAVMRRATADAYAALNRGDYDVAKTRYTTPMEVVLEGFGEGPLPVPARAAMEQELTPEELVGWLQDWREEWGDFWVEPQEIIDLGERTLFLVVGHARGKASGLEVTQPLADVVTWRAGRISRVEHYWRREQALDAVGLRVDGTKREGAPSPLDTAPPREPAVTER